MVGNDSRDDAAVVDLGDGRGLISTTDFFMPIVDDAFDFGRIAAANALSDIYAMGGTPLVAIAILGWPVDKLPPEVAGRVISGGRAACAEAGITLAGGHSIDNPEPIFGLAVNGLVPLDRLQRNDAGQPGDLLWLTKPLGLGLLTTAEKRGKLLPADQGRAASVMKQLNTVGPRLAAIPGVHALTDITGFGLGGHLSEVCGKELGATLAFEDLPRVTDLTHYLEQRTLPGGTRRNASSYANWVRDLTPTQEALLFDPQTSGGLLVAAAPTAAQEVGAKDFLGARAAEGHTIVLHQPAGKDSAKALRASDLPEADRAVLEAMLWWRARNKLKAARVVRTGLTDLGAEAFTDAMVRYASDMPKLWQMLRGAVEGEGAGGLVARGRLVAAGLLGLARAGEVDREHVRLRLAARLEGVGEPSVMAGARLGGEPARLTGQCRLLSVEQLLAGGRQ